MLRRDPLGSFRSPPHPLAAIGRGVLLLKGREGRRGEGKRKGEGRGRGEKEGEGLPPLYLTSS